MNRLLIDFHSPGAEFRGAPFWAWNARLDPEELRRQIRHFHHMGFGGFFMHSRVGLATPYLSPEWFDCIRCCIDEAHKFGMQAWLYDEDRWPSGAAGGLVTKDDRFKERKLAYEILEPGMVSNGSGTTLAWYEAFFDDQRHLCHARRLPERNSGACCLRFFWRYGFKNSWFNGETYLDTMNPQAVQQFIAVTHEAYLREIGEEFSRTVPGIFTDEPCYCHFEREDDSISWSASFEEKFQQRFGYDLLDYLPELFFDGVCETSKARWNYRDLLTSLLADAFSKGIGTWCEKNNLSLTGHVLAEDTLTGQTGYNGSAMRFYEYMQIPGVDLLTEHWDCYATVRQCTSAARQFGQDRRICECYGVTGWDFPLLGHKALGDWLYALGINSRCMHLAWYSMAGEAKRDYPASISYHSPWAEEYRHVEDYFARLGAVLTGGDEKRDILLLHAVESCWCLFTRSSQENNPAVRRLCDSFIHIYNRLFAENLDFDFGDEEILSRIASVDGRHLRVGKALYRVVVLPPLVTIRSSTLKLLKAFAEQGGTVLAIGEPPSLIDAVPSPDAASAYRAFKRVTKDDFTTALSQKFRVISMTTPDGRQAEPLLSRLACRDGEWTLFICNTSHPISDDFLNVPAILDRRQAFPAIAVAVEIPESGALYELDASNGAITEKDYIYENGRYRFSTSFDVLESRLFLISRQRPEGCCPAVTVPSTAELPVPSLSLSSREWDFHLSEDNVLILDHASWSISGGALSSPEYILLIDHAIRDSLGVPRRGGRMVQPWLNPPAEHEDALPVHLEYTFSCRCIPHHCRLAIEHPELCRIYLNGQEIPVESSGWWVDICLKTLPIPEGLLQIGANTLIIEVRYQPSHPGLEAIFLLGKFGVCDDVVVDLPSRLHAGDLCRQGLPYYAGNITYCTSLPEVRERSGTLMVELPAWRGSAAAVRVNGGDEVFLGWPPYRFDAAPYLRFDGRDNIEITIFGHRRNAFGPFYDKEVTPLLSQSRTFYAQEVPERHLVPFGILE